MSSPTTLLVRPRGKPIKGLSEEISVPATGSTADLYKQIANASKYSIHQLRITKGSDGSFIPNSTEISVADTGLRNKSTIYVKDLGTQIAWRTVFIIEYLGPLLIHPLIYYLRPDIYRTSEPPSQAQTLSMILAVVHFMKREYETLFVHRFSNATMPFRNIFKNSAHYWFLSGVNMAFWSYSPSAPTAKPINPLFIYAGLALFTIGELGNLYTHFVLKGLRRPGSTDRGIPRGIGFNLVTCPNYMFEVMSWIGYFLVNWSLSTILFIVVAAAQMWAWAKKKEMRYRKEFGDKYKRKRSFMIPGIC